MSNQRDIKRRIRSVKNTQQITKAMKMVAAAKLRKTQDAVVASRPYSAKLKEILSRIVASSGENLNDPLLEAREVKKVGFVVVAADRGLAGGYNANLLKSAVVSYTKKKQENVDVGIITIGKKAEIFFRKRQYPVEGEFSNIGDIPTLEEMKAITEKIREYYTQGVYDEVYLVYTQFITAMQQKPITKKLLPIEPPAGDELEEVDYIYEPGAKEVLAQLLPLYLQNQVFGSIMEAKASEHGARMTAMDMATDNAGEMIGKLTLSYNRARQAAITREISEIVGGAEAFRG